jgi:hypothetical protein
VVNGSGEGNAGEDAVEGGTVMVADASPWIPEDDVRAGSVESTVEVVLLAEWALLAC